MRGSFLGGKACDNWIACGQALGGRAKRNPSHRKTRRRRSGRRPIAAGVAAACRGNRARRLGADWACALSNGHDAATVAQESAGHMTRASHAFSDVQASAGRRKTPAGRHGGTGHQVDRRRPRCRPSGPARRAGRAPHASVSGAIKGAGLVALGRAIDVTEPKAGRPVRQRAALNISARAPTHRRPQEHLIA